MGVGEAIAIDSFQSGASFPSIFVGASKLGYHCHGSTLSDCMDFTDRRLFFTARNFIMWQRSLACGLR